MTLLSLVLALVMEQFRPLHAAKYLYPLLDAYGRLFEKLFNDNTRQQGIVAWCVMVLPAVLLTGLIWFALFATYWPLAFLFNVAVLYFTMGFRHTSHFFTRIHAALRTDDLDRARLLLSEWRGCSHEYSSKEEVTRLTIEGALVSSHRQVFALIVMFIVFPGPMGAVLYRLSEYYARTWTQPRNSEQMGQFAWFAGKVFYWIDWVPARVTALAFSIVGDFEDAAYCWRMQSSFWPNKNEGVLIAAGAGALGVCLGQAINEGSQRVERPTMGTGDEAEVEYLQGMVGLVRRNLVLNAVVLLFFAITRIV